MYQYPPSFRYSVQMCSINRDWTWESGLRSSGLLVGEILAPEVQSCVDLQELDMAPPLSISLSSLARAPRDLLLATSSSLLLKLGWVFTLYSVTIGSAISLKHVSGIRSCSLVT